MRVRSISYECDESELSCVAVFLNPALDFMNLKYWFFKLAEIGKTL